MQAWNKVNLILIFEHKLSHSVTPLTYIQFMFNQNYILCRLMSSYESLRNRVFDQADNQIEALSTATASSTRPSPVGMLATDEENADVDGDEDSGSPTSPTGLWSKCLTKCSTKKLTVQFCLTLMCLECFIGVRPFGQKQKVP